MIPDKLANLMRQTPSAKQVIERYEDKIYDEVASDWFIGLTVACWMRASGNCSRQSFKQTVSSAAKRAGIPLADMKILAKLQLVLIESALIGTGQIDPIIEGGKE